MSRPTTLSNAVGVYAVVTGTDFTPLSVGGDREFEGLCVGRCRRVGLRSRDARARMCVRRIEGENGRNLARRCLATSVGDDKKPSHCTLVY